MSDGREEREQREMRIEQAKRENREDRIDRHEADEWEPDRGDSGEGRRIQVHLLQQVSAKRDVPAAFTGALSSKRRNSITTLLNCIVMPEREDRHEFDVALSFAGEDRQVAESLANDLVEFGVRVFYDRHEQASLW